MGVTIICNVDDNIVDEIIDNVILVDVTSEHKIPGFAWAQIPAVGLKIASIDKWIDVQINRQT